LTRLGKLPVPYKLDIWSLQGEREALERALVSFIPVNGQAFSRAKSYNRALTAISAGTQVLSPGFPLYRELAPAIYSDSLSLLYDLEDGRCRITAQSVAEVIQATSKVSEVGSVADELYQFLFGLMYEDDDGQTRRGGRVIPRRGPPRREALIYGIQYEGLMIRAARAAGILQVKTPFAQRERAYDIEFAHRRGRQLEVWMSPKLAPLVHGSLKSKCSRPQQRGKYSMMKVDAGPAAMLSQDVIVPGSDARMIVKDTEAYRRFLFDMKRICQDLFPTIHFSLCDMQGYFDEDKASRAEEEAP
jgi:hypothetical protein